MKITFHRNISLLFILVFVISLFGLNHNNQVVSAEPVSSNNPSINSQELLLVGDPPVINVWYGLTQTFGNLGNPQGQIAILGNVTNLLADSVTDKLEYRLNGGELRKLTIGPDDRRLEKAGDFAVELFDFELNATNTVDIVATGTPLLPEDPIPTSTVTVTVYYERDQTQSFPFSITNWVTPTTNSQVVDGKWEVVGGKLHTAEPGYDRMVAIGSMEWQDYEVTVDITPRGIDPNCVDFDCGVPSYTPGIGLIARWTGHTDNAGEADVSNWQPKSGWLPLGAIGWYRWDYDGSGALGIYHDGNTEVYAGNSALTVDVTYTFKFRVETLSNGNPLYRLKVWKENLPEPSAWNVTWQGAPDDPRSGSVVLFSHHIDAEFGEVTVEQINPPVKSEIVFDDFNVCSLDPAVWELYTPVNMAQTSMSIAGAFSGNAELNISIPGGLVDDHNMSLNDNNAARVRQVIADNDFNVEAKFTSTVTQKFQHQGIMVEGVDPNNFMRFEFYSDGVDTYLYTRAYPGDLDQIYADKKIGGAGISPLYLSVYRSGDRWIVGYSLNDIDWFDVASFPYMMVVDKIGLYAGSTKASSTTPAPAHTAKVDYFKDFEDDAFFDMEDVEVGNPLNVSVVGPGSVTKNPNNALYQCDQSVLLTAIADEGYIFSKWQGDLTGVANPAMVIMNGEKDISAVFVLKPIKFDVFLPLITR